MAKKKILIKFTSGNPKLDERFWDVAADRFVDATTVDCRGVTPYLVSLRRETDVLPEDAPDSEYLAECSELLIGANGICAVMHHRVRNGFTGQKAIEDGMTAVAQALYAHFTKQT